MTLINHATFKKDFLNKNNSSSDYKKQMASKIETAIVVETIDTLMAEDLGLTSRNWNKQEDLTALIKVLGFSPEGDTLEELKSNLNKDILLNLDSLITDTYKRFFSKKMLVFDFLDFELNEAFLQNPKEMIYLDKSQMEILGVGDCQTDSEGKEIPHDLKFAKECLFEILHFLSHTNEKKIFDPNMNPVLPINWLDYDKIHFAVLPKPEFTIEEV